MGKTYRKIDKNKKAFIANQLHRVESYSSNELSHKQRKKLEKKHKRGGEYYEQEYC